MLQRDNSGASTSRRLLFIVRGAADVDNIAPVIWACSREQRPVVVVMTSSRAKQLVTTTPWITEATNITLIERLTDDEPRLLRTRLRRLLHHRAAARRLLTRHAVGLLCVEWSEIQTRTGCSHFVRARRWLLNDVVSQLKHAAQDLGLPLVAVPHGHSTKTVMIRSEHVERVMAHNSGKLPFADRDAYDAYVFASAYHRDAILAQSTMVGGNAKVWGSARFNDLWVPRLYAQASTWTPPDTARGRRITLFFVPKWNNLVNRQATLELMASIARSAVLHLVIRGHARESDSGLSSDECRSLQATGNATIVSGAMSSASLISGCDVLVDIDSSIAFDAVILEKPYVRPRYLQDASVTTIWDDLGGAHQTDSASATIGLLESARLTVAPRDLSFADVVFGGRGHEVLDRYQKELWSLVDGPASNHSASTTASE